MLAELPYQTTILAGRLDLGDTWIRAVGLLWLLVGVGFLVAAVLLANQKPSVRRLMTVLILSSLLLCVASWPDSGIGAGVNLALAALLLRNARWPLQALPA